MDGITSGAFQNQVIQDILKTEHSAKDYEKQAEDTTSLSDELLSVYRKLYLEALAERKKNTPTKKNNPNNKKAS